MNIMIVSGSHRQNSQSTKIAGAVNQALSNLPGCDNSDIFDLANNPLPLWDESIWSGDAVWQERLTPISERLANSDAFVIIAPEWHGMVPAGLKNFLLMWGNGELAHKPAFIVTVSSADGGSYPVAELRMSSYKNNRLCFMPEHLIIRFVETVFNNDPSENKASAQEYFEDRMDYGLKQLIAYGEAFKQIRSSGTVSLKTYSSGM